MRESNGAVKEEAIVWFLASLIILIIIFIIIFLFFRFIFLLFIFVPEGNIEKQRAHKSQVKFKPQLLNYLFIVGDNNLINVWIE